MTIKSKMTFIFLGMHILVGALKGSNVKDELRAFGDKAEHLGVSKSPLYERGVDRSINEERYFRNYKLSDTKYVSIEDQIDTNLKIRGFQMLRNTLSKNRLIQFFGNHNFLVLFTNERNKFLVVELGPLAREQLRNKTFLDPVCLREDNKTGDCQGNLNPFESKKLGVAISIYSITGSKYFEFLKINENKEIYMLEPEKSERVWLEKDKTFSEFLSIIRDNQIQTYGMLRHWVPVNSAVGSCITFTDDLMKAFQE